MTHFRRFQPGTLLEGKDAMFMIEDREGWLWIGTNQGLYRYDKKVQLFLILLWMGCRALFLSPVSLL